VESNSGLLANSAGFDILGPALSRNVESAIQSALSDDTVFANTHDALLIFRQALSVSIRNIESHPRGKLFQEFLLKGPYENAGKFPKTLIDQRLSDADTAAAIRFIFFYMINCFKGAVAEFLALKSCLYLMRRLKGEKYLARNARLYFGDSVSVKRAKGKGFLKGADLHILTENYQLNSTPIIVVAGVIEIKSYNQSQHRLIEQLDQHLLRAKRGLRINGVDYSTDKINIGYGKDRRVFRITIVPSCWKLPRTFRYEETEHGRLLKVDAYEPTQKDDEIVQVGKHDWHVTLRWSKEALAEAAYEMTFWYMGKVGEIIYSKGVPKEWENMTKAEAGSNAVKMMLYYAILRARNIREEQRAIALYNSYGFGYAIGMNYKNSLGKREMLWPQDLDEILTNGRTKNGCAIR